MIGMSYKTINGLMKHLRGNSISISGSKQKKHLTNYGYFHGYKGYRFFKNEKNRIPYTEYREIMATIDYDTKIKALFYSRIMFIETAIKNITIESLLRHANTEEINGVVEKCIMSYKNCDQHSTIAERKKYEKNKLTLQRNIQRYLEREYKNDNHKISHYYNNYSGHSNGVPIWALIEVMTLGDFGHFLSCLKHEVREDISNKLSIPVNVDSYRNLIYKYVFFLKDLRNAIAHNDVVFDTRFCTSKPNRGMCLCVENELNIPNIQYKSIVDFVALICYFLYSFDVPKSEIRSFINLFEKYTNDYYNSVDKKVSIRVINPNTAKKINALKARF